MVQEVGFFIFFLWLFIGALFIGMLTHDLDEYERWNWKQHMVLFIVGGPLSWFVLYPYKLMKLIIEKLGD